MRKLYRSHVAFTYIPRGCKTSFMYTKQAIGFCLKGERLKGEQLLEGQLSVIRQEAALSVPDIRRPALEMPLPQFLSWSGNGERLDLGI
jgi:hypothetical protein